CRCCAVTYFQVEDIGDLLTITLLHDSLMTRSTGQGPGGVNAAHPRARRRLALGCAAFRWRSGAGSAFCRKAGSEHRVGIGRLQGSLDALDEAACRHTIDDAVVEGEAEEHHGAHGQ